MLRWFLTDGADKPKSLQMAVHKCNKISVDIITYMREACSVSGPKWLGALAQTAGGAGWSPSQSYILFTCLL